MNFLIKLFGLLIMISSIVGVVCFYCKGIKYTIPTKVIVSVGICIIFLVGYGIFNFKPEPSQKEKLAAEKAKIEQQKKEEEQKKKAEAMEEKTKLLEKFNLIETKVESVLSEDVILLSDGQHLNFLGINVPRPDNNSEEYRNKVNDYIKNALQDKVVYLEKDNLKEDKAGPLLRCVWLEIPKEINDSEIKAKMFNAKLLLEGYGQANENLPDKYKDYFTKYNEEAKGLNRGIWAINSPKDEEKTASNNDSNEEVEGVDEDYEDDYNYGCNNNDLCDECYTENQAGQKVVIINKSSKHHKHKLRKSNKSKTASKQSGGKKSSGPSQSKKTK